MHSSEQINPDKYELIRILAERFHLSFGNLQLEFLATDIGGCNAG